MFLVYLFSIKDKFPINIYRKLYPTGSNPGKFYGTAKVHKISNDGTVNELPLRPIVSNIGTATYELAKNLAKLLSPLSHSEYTIKSTKNFIENIKNRKIPRNYEMISFDVKSLFTNVPLEKTIQIILKRVFVDKEIETSLTRRELKELLHLCTKEVHFSFNGSIYLQKDGVAMCSPLGSVLAGIIMVELERTIVPRLCGHLKYWKRYVDDTITFVRKGSTDIVLKA